MCEEGGGVRMRGRERFRGAVGASIWMRQFPIRPKAPEKAENEVAQFRPSLEAALGKGMPKTDCPFPTQAVKTKPDRDGRCIIGPSSG